MEKKKISIGHKKYLADLFNVTTDYVSKVLNGKRHNKAISDAYAIIAEQEEKTFQQVAQTINAA